MSGSGDPPTGPPPGPGRGPTDPPAGGPPAGPPPGPQRGAGDSSSGASPSGPPPGPGRGPTEPSTGASPGGPPPGPGRAGGPPPGPKTVTTASPAQDSTPRRAPKWLLPVLLAGASIAAGAIVSQQGSDGSTGADPTGQPGEVFAEPADSIGPAPFTPPVVTSAPVTTTATTTSPTTTTTTTIAAATTTATDPTAGSGVAPPPPVVVPTAPGGQPGLYGGTRNNAVCDTAQLVGFLQQNADKAAAWAQAQGIDPSEIPAFVARLTPVTLQSDTRVTNYGYDDGRPVARQAMLQAGTAVLVDDRGVPRVRCKCGNPLAQPEPVTGPPVYTGETWPGFDPAAAQAIDPAPAPLDALVLTDPATGDQFERPIGTSGDADVPLTETTPTTTPLPPTTAIDTTVPATTTPPATTTAAETTVATTAVATTAPATTQAPTNVTPAGEIGASSEYPGGEFPVSFAFDGDRTTSWFSSGEADTACQPITAGAKCSSLIWVYDQPVDVADQRDPDPQQQRASAVPDRVRVRFGDHRRDRSGRQPCVPRGHRTAGRRPRRGRPAGGTRSQRAADLRGPRGSRLRWDLRTRRDRLTVNDRAAFSHRRRRGSRSAAIVAFVLAAAVSVAPAHVRAGAEDPNRPFAQPQYLIHITGHGTTSGDVKDDALVLHPSEPDAEGNFLVADGSGGTFGYGSDYHSGPYTTPSEVCAAAAGRLDPGEGITAFSSSGRDVDCDALAAAMSGTTTSAPTTTSASTTSAATSSSLDEPAPTCNVRGEVIDFFGAPVPGIHISLRAGGLSLETATYDDGTYQFAEIGDDPGGGTFDSRTDPVTVALVAEEWEHDPHRYVVYYRQQGAVLRADQFLIPADGSCERDFDFRAIPATYTSTGPPLNEWPDMVQLYQGIHRAWALADLLGIPLTYGLPLQVRGFCDDPTPPTDCDETEVSFFGTKSSGRQVVDRPLISFGPSESRLLSRNWPDNREYHEFGHYVLAAAFNGVPDRGTDKNHGGYANASSTDAWSEGFAEFWASMVAKYIDRRQRPELYTWNQGLLPSNAPNAPPAPASNLLDIWPAQIDEEFAVAGLLVTLESLDVASTPQPRSPRTLEIKGYTEITDPTFGRLLVGNVVNTTPDGASVGTVVGATFYDANRQPIDSAFGSAIPANLGADGGRGVFVLPIPAGISYADVAVLAHEGAPPAPDPAAPPLDVSLAEIWSAIVSYPGSKPLAAGHVQDVDDLYQALKTAFGGRGSIVDGLDTIDQLFVERGFFDDSDGDRRYVPGDQIGLTSHPAYGDQELCAAGFFIGCSPPRIPRTGYEGSEATTASLQIAASDGALDAAQVYAQVAYPAPNEHRSYGYVVVVDDGGKVQLAIPPPGSGATVVLVAIADDHQPTVLGTIPADSFWQQAEAQHGASFLSFAATLPPGEFEIPDGTGTPTAVAPGSTLPATGATGGGTSTDSSGSSSGGTSALVIIGGLGIAGFLGWRLSRPRARR